MSITLEKLGLFGAAAMFLASAQAAGQAVTAEEEAMVTQWAQRVDLDRDHRVTKAEVIALIEKAFASADAKKSGSLDMKQLAVMLREFDPRAVAVRPTLPRKP